MRNPTFPIFCALSIVLCFITLPWHWKARNTGTLLYIGWSLVGCANLLVNSLVWAGNTNNVAPVWCDISSRIIIAQAIGFAITSLCINRRLYSIATIKHVRYLRDSRRRDLIIDLVLGIGVPAIAVTLYQVIQGDRFSIIEDFGCWPSVAFVTPAIPLFFLSTTIISIISFVYAALTIRAFINTRRQFSRILSDSDSGLNMSRYFRLMAFSSTEMLCSLPISLYSLIINLKLFKVTPWVSWEDTHFYSNYVSVVSFETLEANPTHRQGLDISRWFAPVCVFSFFLYFGLSSEAVEGYKRVFWFIVSPLGFKPPPPKPETNRWPRRIAAALSDITTLNPTESASRDAAIATGRSVSEVAEQDVTEVTTSDLESQTTR